jgi:hypothetical protein
LLLFFKKEALTFFFMLETETSPLETLRALPEFAVFADIPLRLAAGEPDLAASAAGVVLGGRALGSPGAMPFFARWGLEAAWLLRAGVSQGLAGLAAARAAAQFVAAERTPAAQAALPGFVAAMAGDMAPPAAVLATVQAGASAAEIEAIRANWPDLGTAEALMETGGDIRLQRDPRSALNGYGCSHRPRPWAVTFASSTASSSSERGYAAADAARLLATAALFTDGRRAAVRDCLDAVRDSIAEAFGLSGGVAVVLAASGTDTELLALALTHLGAPEAQVRNILVAPAETGRGVPMAARGVHFAINTALGADVTQEAPIAGFRPDTEVTNILLRHPAGGLREPAAVEAEITGAVAAGIKAGARVILHGLDLSKTGLLAPAPAFLRALRARFGNRFDIVIDACQARLSAASVRDYLALDAVVLITGSKFFTGPPFSGAALVPPAVAARLRGRQLPAGLDAYFGRDEFPADCPAAAHLPPVGNYGLALRWHAAMAEMRAVMAVPPARRAEILAAFAATVARKIAENPALKLLPRPPLRRGPHDEAWETLRSIFTLTIQAPHDRRRYLTPAEARAVYVWLNADLSPFLPGRPEIAAKICHIGQPVSLPQAGADGLQGVLRVSAGARLISGEPSHRVLAEHVRLDREMADLATVFDKIGLILSNWEQLWAANPAPRYRVEGRKQDVLF